MKMIFHSALAVVATLALAETASAQRWLAAVPASWGESKESAEAKARANDWKDALASSRWTPNLNADIVGAESPATHKELYIKVGKSVVNAGPHRAGMAGFGLGTMSNGKAVDFDGVAAFSSPTAVKGVRSLATGIVGAPGSHSGFGHFNFVKVGSGDVWFGEWSKDGAAGGFSHRQVYFSGDRTGTTLPAGTATYAVAGLRRFNGRNVLSGTFQANFGSGSLIGSLKGADLALVVKADIKHADASFAGTATANGAVAGVTQGNFFGANAAALAGIATFAGNSQYDTAFGGTKN
jgi:hypothetical protein